MQTKIIDELRESGGLELLAKDGIAFPTGTARAISRHTDLVVEWNPFASLVSSRDAGRLATAHVLDSLSLAPVIVRRGYSGGRLLDIGSGGGFPALPLKLVLPELRVVLVERSGRKATFLRKVLATLKISDVEVLRGGFPECAPGETGDLVTARAVEKPEAIMASLLKAVRPGGMFLCQSGDPTDLVGPGFHVEREENEWHSRGLRRGELHCVTRKP